MSRLALLLLQEAGEVPMTSTVRTTVLDLLRDNMDGLDSLRRKKSLKERLGFISGCCGPIRLFQPTVHDDEEEEEGGNQQPQDQQPQQGEAPDAACGVTESEVGQGMNLAAALAAERQYRAAQERELSARGTSLRVSLMRLLEEAEEGGGVAGSESGCCVCMVRKKGSAFITCGHTFCRVCSREVWLNRGSCPLCNRPILDILDIF